MSKHQHDLVRGKHGSITPRPAADGTLRYRVRWTDHTGRHSRTFEDAHDAEAFLLGVRTSQSRGTYRSPQRMTVAELVEAYLERLAQDHAPATVATYQQRSRDYLLPHLGSVVLERLDVPTVQRWVDRLGRTLAPSTVRVVGAILSGACADAVRAGLLPRNPTTGVRFPKRRRSETEVWSLEEVRTVLRQTAEDGLVWHALYVVALTTGMRRGELLGLLWDSVDLSSGTLTVRRTMSRDREDHIVLRETTKTGRPRTVPLSPHAAALLAQLPHREGHVFRSPGGHPYLPPSTWQRYHEQLCQRTGVQRIRLHDLRHQSATLSLYAGTEAKLVSERLGHSTVAMTLDRYTHSVSELQRQSMARLDALFDVAHDNTEGA